VLRGLAAVLVLAVAGHARAEDLDEARRLEANLEYEQALTLVERAIAHGANEPRHLAQLHFEAGKLAAGLDREAIAENHFMRALALDATLALPAGTSPKVAAPFEAARARSRPLRVAHRRTGHRVTVAAEPDPSHLVAVARVRFIDRAGHHQELASGPPFAIDLPAEARAIEVVASDEYGNQLYSAVEEPAAPVAPRDGAWYGSWKLWAGATVFAGGIAGLCAWRERVAQDDWNALEHDSVPHDYSQLKAVEDRGRNWALAANIGFAVAGAAAIVTAISAVTHRSEPAITVTAAPGSIGIAGRF